MGRLKTVIRKSPIGEELQKFDQFYDQSGNLCRKVESVYREGKIDREITTKWEYDALNRVVALIEAVDTAEQKESRYIYDAMGQIQTPHKS